MPKRRNQTAINLITLIPMSLLLVLNWVSKSHKHTALATILGFVMFLPVPLLVGYFRGALGAFMFPVFAILGAIICMRASPADGLAFFGGFFLAGLVVMAIQNHRIKSKQHSGITPNPK